MDLHSQSTMRKSIQRDNSIGTNLQIYSGLQVMKGSSKCKQFYNFLNRTRDDPHTKLNLRGSVIQIVAFPCLLVFRQTG